MWRVRYYHKFHWWTFKYDGRDAFDREEAEKVARVCRLDYEHVRLEFIRHRADIDG